MADHALRMKQYLSCAIQAVSEVSRFASIVFYRSLSKQISAVVLRTIFDGTKDVGPVRRRHVGR
jgi:hypothetical protein